MNAGTSIQSEPGSGTHVYVVVPQAVSQPHAQGS
jgi:hypothetical protein